MPVTERRPPAAPLPTTFLPEASLRSGPAHLERVLTLLAASLLVALALVVTPSAYDPYRLPKELLLRAGAIMLAAIAVIRWVMGDVRLPRWNQLTVFAAAAMLWTVVSTLVSRNPTLSVYSCAFVAACITVALAAVPSARAGSRIVLNGIVAAGAINGILCVLAHFVRTNSYYLATMHGRSVGLLGSATDTSAYLSLVIIAAAAMAIADSRRRLLYGAAAICMAAGLLATQTLGAIVAVLAGVTVMAAFVSTRRAMIGAIAAVILIAAGATAFYQPLRVRVTERVNALAAGNIDDLLAARGAPMLAAMSMFRDRPLAGVGPGCFGFEYAVYKAEVEDEYRSLMYSGTRQQNFSEVHNDHLQLLAQGGVPAYLLFLAMMFAVARGSFTHAPRGDVLRDFARLASLPLVVTTAIVTLVEFALELAAPAATLVALAVLCVVWSRRGIDATA